VALVASLLSRQNIKLLSRGVINMANGNQNQVLSETDLTRINQALAQLDRADQVIDMANRAGIPVDQFQKDAKDRRDKLLRIKNTFFPGR
jgi:hypothetical protein